MAAVARGSGSLQPVVNLDAFPPCVALACLVVLSEWQVGVRYRIVREGILKRTHLPGNSSRKGGDEHRLM